MEDYDENSSVFTLDSSDDESSENPEMDDVFKRPKRAKSSGPVPPGASSPVSVRSGFNAPRVIIASPSGSEVDGEKRCVPQEPSEKRLQR